MAPLGLERPLGGPQIGLEAGGPRLELVRAAGLGAQPDQRQEQQTEQQPGHPAARGLTPGRDRRSLAAGPAGHPLEVGGWAGAGELGVGAAELSTDFGQTWSACKLSPPANRLAWQRMSGRVVLPEKGYYEIWARATDSEGNRQPMLVPGWNPKGYLNNACHRIAVRTV